MFLFLCGFSNIYLWCVEEACRHWMTLMMKCWRIIKWWNLASLLQLLLNQIKAWYATLFSNLSSGEFYILISGSCKFVSVLCVSPKKGTRKRVCFHVMVYFWDTSRFCPPPLWKHALSMLYILKRRKRNFNELHICSV